MTDHNARSQRPPATGFGALLKSREFRVLWIADAQSMVGDQLARVAVSVLVYERTRSGLATAVVYALTFLPALFGSVLLGPLADLIPRRSLLIVGDLTRAALLALTAIPGLNLLTVAALLSAAVLVGAPWKAAESALVVDILTEQDYSLGVGLRTATLQAAQLIGFAAGGLVVAIIGARHALAFDAGTFLLSAALIRGGVRVRPPPSSVVRQAGGTSRWLDGAASVLTEPRLRLLLAQSWLLGLLVVPEGLASPYAYQLGGGPGTVGLLLSAGPAGVLVGTVSFARWVPAYWRSRLLGPLAAAAGLPLVACAIATNLSSTLALWAISGACTAYQVQVITEFVAVVSPAIRGQGIALATAGLLAAQGLGLILGGFIAQIASAPVAIAIAGATACIIGAILAALRRRQLGPLRAESAQMPSPDGLV